MINPELKIGDRVVMLYMEGESFRPGVVGTVKRIVKVFGIIQYEVSWDNGSNLHILSDVDKWVKEDDWKSMREKRKKIQESIKPGFNEKYRDLLKNYEMGKIHKYMNNLRESGVVNMFGSSPYLYLGKERIAHEHFYTNTDEKFDEVLEMADKIRDVMIRGSIKSLEGENKEISIENVKRKMEKDARRILTFLFDIH